MTEQRWEKEDYERTRTALGALVRVKQTVFKGKQGQIVRVPAREGSDLYVVDVVGQRDRLYLYRYEFEVISVPSSSPGTEP